MQYHLAILPPLSTIPPPTQERPARMSDFIKPQKLTFEQVMGVSSHLPKQIERAASSNQE